MNKLITLFALVALFQVSIQTTTPSVSIIEYLSLDNSTYDSKSLVCDGQVATDDYIIQIKTSNQNGTLNDYNYTIKDLAITLDTAGEGADAKATYLTEKDGDYTEAGFIKIEVSVGNASSSIQLSETADSTTVVKTDKFAVFNQTEFQAQVNATLNNDVSNTTNSNTTVTSFNVTDKISCNLTSTINSTISSYIQTTDTKGCLKLSDVQFELTDLTAYNLTKDENATLKFNFYQLAQDISAESGYAQDGKSQLSLEQTILVKENEYFKALNGTEKNTDFNLIQNYQLVNGSASVQMEVLVNDTMLFSADLILQHDVANVSHPVEGDNYMVTYAGLINSKTDQCTATGAEALKTILVAFVALLGFFNF